MSKPEIPTPQAAHAWRHFHEEKREPHANGTRPIGFLPMLTKEQVQVLLEKLHNGLGLKQIARDLGVDIKTVKRWREIGAWHPRKSRHIQNQQSSLAKTDDRHDN